MMTNAEKLEARVNVVLMRFIANWPEAEPTRHLNSTDAYRIGYAHGAREVCKQIHNEIQAIKCGA